MIERTMMFTTTKTSTTATAVALAVAGALLLGAAPAQADPDAPGCAVTSAEADHVHGVVVFDLRCDEPRDVVVDATAWHGDADDHQVVDTRTVTKHVGAGERWSSAIAFATDTDPSTDQITAQVLSWIDQGDTQERPAILATVAG
ncbi:hypothetical protein [Curtobacterium sp. ZW137]|uniref:hypothetical protein n=1 Tax=Curtobacterium sp. ZW137 TaxID=2485104 RepID=UPI0011CE5E6F|nr:hypothetical protein [Curtobacterium sp. ZW137]